MSLHPQLLSNCTVNLSLFCTLTPHPGPPAESTMRRVEEEEELDDDKSRRVVRKWTVEEDQLMMQLVSVAPRKH